MGSGSLICAVLEDEQVRFSKLGGLLKPLGAGGKSPGPGAEHPAVSGPPVGALKPELRLLHRTSEAVKLWLSAASCCFWSESRRT